MEHYIDPIVFYFIDLAGDLKIASLVFGTFVIIAAFLFWGFGFDACDNEAEEKLHKSAKIMFPIGLVLIFVGIITPSQETCEKMLLADIVTPANVEGAKDETKELIDYIFDKFEEMENADN